MKQASNLPDDFIPEDIRSDAENKDRDDLINYAVKEGFLSEDEVMDWTEQEKDDYYAKSLERDYDPEE